MALPKTIFVRKEKDGDEEYLIAQESLDDAVEEAGVTLVGLYHLESVSHFRKVSQEVKLKRRG